MNYDNEMERIISKLTFTPKLLLHSCCAPCSSEAIERLKDYFDITIIYYNPNIEPYEEYAKRKEEQIKFLDKITSPNKLDFIDVDYDNAPFQKLSKNHEADPERGKRCFLCYKERLTYVFNRARELGYDYFGTTLTISPYKVSSWINEIGYSLEDDKTHFLPADFKKNDGYKRSIEYSKKYGLYRQDYCGCKFSLIEHEKKVLRQKLVFDTMVESDLRDVAKLYDEDRPIATNKEKMINNFNILKDNPDYKFIVVRIDKEIIGFVNLLLHHDLFENGKDFMTVWSLRVKKNYRNKGIAKYILSYVEGTAKTLDCSFISLIAESDNKIACKLYESIGYSLENGYVKFL